MANGKRPIKSVQIRANFRSSVRIFAGDSEPDAAAMQYVTAGNPSRKLVDEVFAKTIKAIHDPQPSILLVIRDDKFIEEDADFRLPGEEDEVAKAKAARKPATRRARAAPKRASPSGGSPKKPRKKNA
jgi:hypothetical protein